MAPSATEIEEGRHFIIMKIKLHLFMNSRANSFFECYNDIPKLCPVLGMPHPRSSDLLTFFEYCFISSRPIIDEGRIYTDSLKKISKS